MPCMDSSGELTETAGKILAAMTTAVPLSEVAQKTGLPLYRVRSAARELVESGLAEETDGIYVAADAGRAALAKSPGKF
jgi:predicted transcriptional regulator